MSTPAPGPSSAPPKDAASRKQALRNADDDEIDEILHGLTRDRTADEIAAAKATEDAARAAKTAATKAGAGKKQLYNLALDTPLTGLSQLVIKDDQIVILPINKSIRSLKGILPKPSISLTCEEMNNIIKDTGKI